MTNREQEIVALAGVNLFLNCNKNPSQEAWKAFHYDFVREVEIDDHRKVVRHVEVGRVADECPADLLLQLAVAADHCQWHAVAAEDRCVDLDLARRTSIESKLTDQ